MSDGGRRALADAAIAVAEQYRAGEWPPLSRGEWPEVWAFLIDEIRRRAPGFSERDYGEALNRALSDSR